MRAIVGAWSVLLRPQLTCFTRDTFPRGGETMLYLNPGRVGGQAHKEEHVETILQQVHPVIANLPTIITGTVYN